MAGKNPYIAQAKVKLPEEPYTITFQEKETGRPGEP